MEKFTEKEIIVLKKIVKSHIEFSENITNNEYKHNLTKSKNAKDKWSS